MNKQDTVSGKIEKLSLDFDIVAQVADLTEKVNEIIDYLNEK